MRFSSLIFLCAVFLVSCDENPKGVDTDPPKEAAAGDHWPATVVSDGGGFSVTLKPSGGEIEWNKHFGVEFFITPENPAVGPLKVVVDADMPAHRHGMNTKPELFDQGDLSYRVEGMLFHMKGDWVISVEVSGDGSTERAEFPVLVE
jgi:hypothetical protein